MTFKLWNSSKATSNICDSHSVLPNCQRSNVFLGEKEEMQERKGEQRQTLLCLAKSKTPRGGLELPCNLPLIAPGAFCILLSTTANKLGIRNSRAQGEEEKHNEATSSFQPSEFTFYWISVKATIIITYQAPLQNEHAVLALSSPNPLFSRFQMNLQKALCVEPLQPLKRALPMGEDARCS